MIVTIINDNNDTMQVGVDGAFIAGLSSSSLASNIHAVQWDGESGTIEYKDPLTGRLNGEETISSIGSFQFAIDARQAAADALAAERVAQAAAEAAAAAAAQEANP